MNPDEVRREQNAVTQLLGRQRTDFNRIRLAILLTLAKTPQDDQRPCSSGDGHQEQSGIARGEATRRRGAGPSGRARARGP
jgi:hypothetical protein